MPLDPRKTKEAVSKNISELTEANKSKPASKKRPRKQIVAIALSTAGRSNKPTRGKIQRKKARKVMRRTTTRRK